MKTKPILGITLGDPAGIGPEITIKALSQGALYEECRPLVIGDLSVLERAAGIPGIPKVAFHSILSPNEGFFQCGTIDVLDLGIIDAKTLPYGKVTPQAGNAAFQYVKKAIELAMAGEVDATVTNAINKEAINAAGHHYSGHTEIYAEFTNTKKYTMLLVEGDLRVVHVSTHVSLREACDRAKKDRILEVIRIADNACREMGIAQPKIGVAGLNPHCGENGLFGTEEAEEITPAILAAQAQGIQAEGPIPPDSIFPKARGGWYDMVVAMYHDQGHIPLKTVGFVYSKAKQQWEAVKGVNITLGLPIIRTSVDHGTAFDQAGQGTANEISLVNAIEYAIQFARGRIHKQSN